MGKARHAGAVLPSMQTSGSKPCPCPSFKLREVASMYFTMIAVFLVILVVALQGSVPQGSNFPYKVPLDPQGLLELSWNVSYPEQAVNFQLLIRDLQFGLLFGMSDRGEFENADLAVLWSDGHNSYFGVSCSCVCMAAFGVASGSWFQRVGLLQDTQVLDCSRCAGGTGPKGLGGFYPRASHGSGLRYGFGTGSETQREKDRAVRQQG